MCIKCSCQTDVGGMLGSTQGCVTVIIFFSWLLRFKGKNFLCGLAMTLISDLKLLCWLTVDGYTWSCTALLSAPHEEPILCLAV